MALHPGESLARSKYRIIRLLGRGGFGFVYLAEDTLLRKQRAIKELIPALAGDPMTLRRFFKEASATQEFRHPNIVATYDLFTEGENYYIVMEYLPGGSLSDRLAASLPLTQIEAQRLGVEIAEGLAHAHAHGVVHCDLKPANILLTHDGHAKIADFGIAHISDAGAAFTRSLATSTGLAAGTLPYMAPEQARGRPVDQRADVFAFGVVLYEMLTGVPPFDDISPPSVALQHLTQPPPAPRSLNPQLNAETEAVLLKALNNPAVQGVVAV